MPSLSFCRLHIPLLCNRVLSNRVCSHVLKKTIIIIIENANKNNDFWQSSGEISIRKSRAWDYPKIRNERFGRKADTLILTVCTDTGCACYSLKFYIQSHIAPAWNLQLRRVCPEDADRRVHHPLHRQDRRYGPYHGAETGRVPQEEQRNIRPAYL